MRVRKYCAEIVKAGNRMEPIVQSLAKRNSVTEKLKAENQMEWVRQINACKVQTGAIVKFELIYDDTETARTKMFGRSFPNGRFLHNFMI